MTAGLIGIQFGESTDKVVPADYEGDGKADIVAFEMERGIRKKVLRVLLQLNLV